MGTFSIEILIKITMFSFPEKKVWKCRQRNVVHFASSWMFNLVLDTQETLGGQMGNRETLFSVTQGEYITKRQPDENNVENIARYLETTLM